MNRNRFIIIVLDGFGVGAMDDVISTRPQDINANTAKHLIENGKNINFHTLIDLGLINVLGEEINGYKMNSKAVFGCSNLAHFGCDTYFGHQEILGTKPIMPVLNKFSDFIDIIENSLKKNGYKTNRIKKDDLGILCVNDSVFVGDNLETDAGQAINVTGSFDLSSFEEIKAIGQIVRKDVKVSRVIAFGGENVSFNDLVKAINQKDGYIGVSAPNSGVYKKGYRVVHIGYGVDINVQLPHILYSQKGIISYLYGKVADIVENPHGKLFQGVDTAMLLDEMIKDLQNIERGFFCLNVQETDLAGHLQDANYYIDRLNTADAKIKTIIENMDREDILLIMADHGNDPFINGKHNREKVPLLIKKQGLENINIGLRDTLADSGATAADYFGTSLAYGKSFLSLIKVN
jgi:phosphopentomutase